MATRSQGWRIGSIAGAPLYLTSGWIILTIAVVVLLTPTTALRLSLPTTQAAFVTFLVPLLLAASVLLHELAHGYAARRFGVPVREYVLSIWGGHTTFRREAATPGAMAAIAVAGPVANGLIGLAFWLVKDSAGPVLSYILWLLMWTNVAVMLFNLLPASPLDGGKLLVAALWKASGSHGRAMVWAGRAGIVLALMMLLGVVWWSNRQFLNPTQLVPYLVVAAFFVMMMVQGAYTQIRQGKAYQRSATIDLWQLAIPTAGIGQYEMISRVDELLKGTTTAVVLLEAGEPVGVVDPSAYRAVPLELRESTPIRATSIKLEPQAIIPLTQGSQAVQLVAQAARRGHASVVLHDGSRPPALLRVRDLADSIKDR